MTYAFTYQRCRFMVAGIEMGSNEGGKRRKEKKQRRKERQQEMKKKENKAKDTQLIKWRAGGHVPYLRSLDHIGRSNEFKEKSKMGTNRPTV